MLLWGALGHGKAYSALHLLPQTACGAGTAHYSISAAPGRSGALLQLTLRHDRILIPKSRIQHFKHLNSVCRNFEVKAHLFVTVAFAFFI